ncbi:hypothetical protein OSB04_un000186 [Centaurea solstitialis]|uniref:Reverse transcriptase domain-containing protein n=1 Tax=Centaurea solstitialis TaxID=347529 RepID=A0AA38SP34_9ASTR|nr:hypothetical protein OSB04_un000186 [Centaurea solstitialis]
MNEQRMRSDQQKKLNDLLEERSKLSSKVKELEKTMFKAHDSSNVDGASRSDINSSGQIRTSNLFYDRRVDYLGNHRFSNGKFVWQVKGFYAKDIDVSMINPEPDDLPKKHNPRLDLVCEGVNEMNIETRSVDNSSHPTKLLKYLLKDVCFNSHGELAYHLSNLHSEDLDIELQLDVQIVHGESFGYVGFVYAIVLVDRLRLIAGYLRCGFVVIQRHFVAFVSPSTTTFNVVQLGEPDPTMVVTDDVSDDEVHSSLNEGRGVSNNRTSVFERLETDERLKISEATLNFAKAVGDGGSTALSFFPLATKVQSSVRIPLELATEAMNTHKATLYGYFLGPRLHFPVVERYVKAVWGKFGFSEAMMNNNGIYFLKFNDVGGSNQAVEAGPLMIRGVPFFVEHWDPVKGLTKPVHNTCPLWVKLHDVPLVAFNKEGISRIASALGVPKQMDACTTSMCDKAWGRPGFAKVLIETWAVGELKRELQVVIPSLSGGDDTTVKIRVEYLWEPIQCSHCMVFGHKTSTCVKAVVAQKNKGKSVVIDDDGFTKVQRKEWRPKQGGSTSGTKVQDPGVEAPSNSTTVLPTIPAPTVQVVENVPGKDVESRAIESVVEQNVVVSPKQGTVGGSVVNVEKRPISKPVDRHFSAPLDVPLKTILKNTNRFSPLNEADVSKGDGGKERKRVVDPSSRPGAQPSIHPMFNIGCWNIWGLNAPDKQMEVSSFIRNNGIHLCAILETHVRAESLHSICDRTFGRWKWVSNCAQSEYGTRIIISWDVSCLDVMVLEAHGQFMHCEVRIRGVTEGLFVSFVYGANHGQMRQSLWSGLQKFRAILGAKPWVILGDFNCLLFPHDALGGTSRRNGDMAEFASCLEDIDVFDVRFMGVHHTWCQKPKEEGGIKRKLDRILANVEFTNLFLDAQARFLPRGLSDHSPGIVSFKGGVRSKRYGFKFDNFLTQDPKFLETVHRHWNVDIQGTFMFRVTSKLKLLKAPLKKLRSAYGNLSVRTAKLKEDLDVAQLAADLDPGNVSLGLDVARSRSAYQLACWTDLSAARQRAKVKWLMEGDANTRYFHKVVEEKRHAQFVHSVGRPDGTYAYDDDVATAFIEHFVSIIGTKDVDVKPFMPAELFSSKLSLVDALHMIRPILSEEIRDAMFHIGNDKAPGSDGFSSRFFKSAWDIVGSDILLAIHNFFYRGDCMKPYLDGIISRSQSAFIPGRKIVDNILMAHELVAGYNLGRGPPRCAFKIDLRKAYDMLSWDYLFGMLEGFDFHPIVIKWIKELVSTPSFSVVVNGESRGFFHGKRGIRQGDPLSPYLFTLAMEGFSMILKQCIAEATDFGFHHACEDFGITHLCFADDLFVFTRGDVASVEVLKKALSLFALRSGLSPNLQKSDIFFGNVPLEEKEAILHCLPFRTGTFPIRYLGVPLSPVTLRNADYSSIIAKVQGRLQNWKSKFLSFGGRRQLISSVLQSLQLYWMAIFVFPSGVIHELERLCRDFLWTQGDPSRGRCKVAWALVCRPKSCGGLGFRRLAVWNRALIAKNLWSLITNRNCLWVDWIRQYSFRNHTFWEVRKNNRWSWVLAKMMLIRTEIRRFVVVRIGNGLTTNAWNDNWLTCGPLSEVISARFIHGMSFSRNTTVRQLLDTFHDGWPDTWTTRYPILVGVDLPVIVNDVPDVHCWGTLGRGVCTVHNMYNSLIGDFDLVPWADSVWFKGHIPKHSFCMWVACLRRLPTQDRMAAWKHDPPDLLCSLCGLVLDSHDHLFFECTFARQVWLQVLAKVNSIDFPCSWEAILDAISNSGTAPSTLTHRLVLAASVYFVWCERNTRIFTADRNPIPVLVQRILSAVFDRVAWKQQKVAVDFTHVVMTGSPISATPLPTLKIGHAILRVVVSIVAKCASMILLPIMRGRSYIKDICEDMMKICVEVLKI